MTMGSSFIRFLPNTVVNFHAIYDPAWIEHILLSLKSLYSIISSNDLIEYYYGKSELKNACHITFDDGDRSFYEIVFPLLKKYDIPVSLFVSPLKTRNNENFWFQELRNCPENMLQNEIIKRYPELSNIISSYSAKEVLKSLPVGRIWECICACKEDLGIGLAPRQNITTEELIEIYNSGLVSIGAHTQNHPILKNESDEISKNEIQSSVNDLNSMLNFESKFFAYPNGIPMIDFDNREISYLKKTGVKLAFSTKCNGFSKHDNVYSIPRIGISKGNRALMIFKLLIGDKWNDVKKILRGNQENDNRRMIIAILQKANQL